MNEKDIQLISTLIGNVGFPIFVATYFLVKVERIMKEINVTLTKLHDRIGQCPYNDRRNEEK